MLRVAAARRVGLGAATEHVAGVIVMARTLPLLVVDGYNVIFASERYRVLIDEDAGDAYGTDPFIQARELLLADVAAYAQKRFEATIVFDAANNVSPVRPNSARAGVQLVFSETGESADTVIERLVSAARRENREVTLVTSDKTVRATVGGIPVTHLSSALLVHEIETGADESWQAATERQHQHLTVADRLSPADRAKLDHLLGRR